MLFSKLSGNRASGSYIVIESESYRYQFLGLINVYLIWTVHMEMWGFQWDIAAKDNFTLRAFVSTSHLDFRENGVTMESWFLLLS